MEALLRLTFIKKLSAQHWDTMYVILMVHLCMPNYTWTENRCLL